MIRPPGPEPVTWARLTCDASASFRASGLDLSRLVPVPCPASPVSTACWPLPFSGTCWPLPPVDDSDADGFEATAAFSPPPRLAATCFGSSPFFASTKTRWPSATSSPAAWSICTIVPSSYDFIAIVALSVSISASESPSLIWSPTLTSHCAITPVSIVGLSFGIVTSIGTSVLPGSKSREWMN